MAKATAVKLGETVNMGKEVGTVIRVEDAKVSVLKVAKCKTDVKHLAALFAEGNSIAVRWGYWQGNKAAQEAGLLLESPKSLFGQVISDLTWEGKPIKCTIGMERGKLTLVGYTLSQEQMDIMDSGGVLEGDHKIIFEEV